MPYPSRMSKTVVVSQSNYAPWRGYFDLIASADVHVVLDDVQYTKQDWRNRNRINTPKGPAWISIPVNVTLGQRIDEVTVAGAGWVEQHWARIEQSYKHAAAFKTMGPLVRGMYESVADTERLTDVNDRVTQFLCDQVGVHTPRRDSKEFPSHDDPTDRLVGMCTALEADVYLSGPAAQAYLDVDKFSAVGIAVKWMDYGEYAAYPQVHGEWQPGLSVLDLLLNVGDEAPALLRQRAG
jgi:hypothetical protein